MSAHPGITWPFTVGTETEPEPTDAELGGAVTDPYDSPSYTTLPTLKGPTT